MSKWELYAIDFQLLKKSCETLRLETLRQIIKNPERSSVIDVSLL